jgi:hypothetical protein
LARAVFCRAILEGALKEIADPQSETSQSIHDMIALAVEKRILTGDGPRCTRAVAKQAIRQSTIPRCSTGIILRKKSKKS